MMEPLFGIEDEADGPTLRRVKLATLGTLELLLSSAREPASLSLPTARSSVLAFKLAGWSGSDSEDMTLVGMVDGVRRRRERRRRVERVSPKREEERRRWRKDQRRVDRT